MFIFQFAKRLQEFGVDEKRIVGNTGDGAPTMSKFGRIAAALYLLCINHGIHLAVMDIIFPKKTTPTPSAPIPTAPAPEPVHDESSDEDSDSAETETDRLSDNEEEGDDETIPIEVEIREKFRDTITRMRKVEVMFKRSPVKNSLLQKFILRDAGSKLQLKLDSKTRWNSLVESAIRFLRVVAQIEEALRHKSIKKPELWSQQDTEVLQVIYLGP